MNILFVTPYFPPHIGGAEHYVYQIAIGLRKAYRWNSIVVTTNTETSQVMRTKQDGMTVYRLPIFRTLSNTPVHPLWYFHIRKIIRTEKPDCINAHAPVPYIADMASLCAKSLPFVLTYHSGPMALKGEWIKDALITGYERYVLPSMLHRATRLISTSAYVKQSVLSAYRQKTHIITPGVDTRAFRPAKRVSGTKLLFVGNLNKAEQYKGLSFLLNALPLVKKTVPTVSLTVVGDGDYVPEYRQMCTRLSLEEHVRFTGSLHGADVQKQYQNASLLVHPSLFDSFPLVLLEAAASALPVVSTTIGGIPEIVESGKNGLLVQPGTVAPLARAISTILLHPDMAQVMSRTQRSKAVRTFDWSRKVAETKDFFEDML